MPLWIVQLVKPFLDPKTFRKVKFVYSKNPESQKILAEYFEEDAIKSILEDQNDYTHDEYAKLMQDDDQKSALYWKGAGLAKAEAEPAAEDQSRSVELPEAGDLKREDAPAKEDAPAPVSESSEPVGDSSARIEVASAPPAPAPVAAPVVAPVSWANCVCFGNQLWCVVFNFAEEFFLLSKAGEGCISVILSLVGVE